jgi:HNH endonuclease
VNSNSLEIIQSALVADEPSDPGYHCSHQAARAPSIIYQLPRLPRQMDPVRRFLRAKRNFFAKVKAVESGCWEWQACCSPTGYGKVGFWWQGACIQQAHRMAWFLYTGTPPPNELDVLHHCDNPPCVRFKHLFLGTQQVNIVDMVNKQRQRGAVGERNRHAKLTAEQVIALRAQATTWKKRDGNFSDALKRLGISNYALCAILSGKTWKHLEQRT